MFRLIAASSLILPLVAGSGWKLNQNSAWCTGGFSLSRLDLLCDNDGACTMGEPLEMQGQLYSYYDGALSETSKVHVKACTLGFMCYSWEFNSVDLCSKMNIQATSGDDMQCPSAGYYNFDTTFTAGGDSTWYFKTFEGYAGVTVTAIITSSSSEASSGSISTTCSFSMSPSSGSSSGGCSCRTSQIVAFCSVAVALFGTAWWVRRRKLRAEKTNLLDMEHSPEANMQASEVELMEKKTALV